MNKNISKLVLSALVAGLVSGTAALAQDAGTPDAAPTPAKKAKKVKADKASCTGKDKKADKASCTGKDKKADKNSCTSKNGCNGKAE